MGTLKSQRTRRDRRGLRRSPGHIQVHRAGGVNRLVNRKIGRRIDDFQIRTTGQRDYVAGQSEQEVGTGIAAERRRKRSTKGRQRRRRAVQPHVPAIDIKASVAAAADVAVKCVALSGIAREIGQQLVAARQRAGWDEIVIVTVCAGVCVT